jgi:hypothetical protein
MLAAELARARGLAPPARLQAPSLDAETAAEARVKEGVYCCACVLEYQMADHVDFLEWLQGSLLPEMQVVRRSLRSMFGVTVLWHRCNVSRIQAVGHWLLCSSRSGSDAGPAQWLCHL